jgi:hypothetical protein
MAGQVYEFHCKACGHAFAGAWEVISRQPTCPNCRTYGQLTDANGRPVGGGKQNVVRVPQPGKRAAPYASQQQHGAADDYEDDVVEVRADVVYGGKSSKNLVTTVILVILGIGIALTLWFIVSVFKGDRTEEARQQREVVQDPKEFERAIDEAVGKVRALLKTVPDAEVQETTNFDEAIKAIQAGGGVTPGWSAPPKPGQPFAVHGFLIKAPIKQRNNPDKVTMSYGFVMLLYYKTSGEVSGADSEIKRDIGGDKRNYSIYSNPSVWYVTYAGYDYGGVVKDAIDKAMKLGTPVPRQFTDRTGSTLREDLK